jgi:uncharacterized membrane protein
LIQTPVALLAFLFLVIAFTRVLENQFALVKKITSAVVCTLTGIVLANVGIIPHRAPLYDAIFEFAIPYAIALVVLASSLSDLKRAGPRLVVAFALAGVGSFVGAVLGGVFFGPLVGDEAWKLGGQFVGAFFGGGMNFAAIGQGLEVSPSLFAAGAVAINLTTVPWLLSQMALAKGLESSFAPPLSDSEHEGVGAVDDDPRSQWVSASVSITDLALLAAIPLVILSAARVLVGLVPGFPEVLWITTLALLIAQLPPLQRLRGSAFASYFAMHLFFIVIGAQSVLREVLNAGPAVLAFMVTTILVHAIVLFVVGYFLRFDIRTLSVASQAAVGGPGSALALSMSMNWSRLVTPGIIIGIFGYAVGNYLGFACAYVLRGLLS